jgi:hypothetical protein
VKETPLGDSNSWLYAQSSVWTNEVEKSLEFQ